MSDQDVPNVEAESSTGSVSSLPVRNSSPSKPGPIFAALEEMESAIRNLDNELANFYDDISPVLYPDGPSDPNKISMEPEVPRSEITQAINANRDLINRIAEHVRNTRERIEL